jgi:hypothetical protein
VLYGVSHPYSGVNFGNSKGQPFCHSKRFIVQTNSIYFIEDVNKRENLSVVSPELSLS